MEHLKKVSLIAAQFLKAC